MQKTITVQAHLEERPVIGADYESDECFIDENGAHPLLRGGETGYHALYITVASTEDCFVGLLCSKCSQALLKPS